MRLFHHEKIRMEHFTTDYYSALPAANSFYLHYQLHKQQIGIFHYHKNLQNSFSLTKTSPKNYSSIPFFKRTIRKQFKKKLKIS